MFVDDTRLPDSYVFYHFIYLPPPRYCSSHSNTYHSDTDSTVDSPVHFRRCYTAGGPTTDRTALFHLGTTSTTFTTILTSFRFDTVFRPHLLPFDCSTFTSLFDTIRYVLHYSFRCDLFVSHYATFCSPFGTWNSTFVRYRCTWNYRPVLISLRHVLCSHYYHILLFDGLLMISIYTVIPVDGCSTD